MVVFAVFVCTVSWSQDSYFRKFENMNFVDYKFASGNQLKSQVKLNGNEVDVRKIADKVKDVIIISMNKPVIVKVGTSYTPAPTLPMIDEAHKSLDYMKSNGYENLVKRNNRHETLRAYSKEINKDINEYVIYHEEKDEINIVVITGKLPMYYLKKLMKH